MKSKVQRLANGYGFSTLIVLLLTTLVSAAGADTPVVFLHGSAHGKAHGYLYGIHAHARFYFQAHSGQHVRVKITGQGPTRGIVTYPHGQQNGSPGGVVFDETVNQTGRYHLLVTESQMGEAWRGRVRVDVWRH